MYRVPKLSCTTIGKISFQRFSLNVTIKIVYSASASRAAFATARVRRHIFFPEKALQPLRSWNLPVFILFFFSPSSVLTSIYRILRSLLQYNIRIAIPGDYM